MKLSEIENKLTNQTTMKQSAVPYLLLYEASTRIVLTLPIEMKLKVDEFRGLIRSVADYFKNNPGLDTDDFCLFASKYSHDFEKYRGRGSVNVLGAIGAQRIFIVRKEAIEQ
ncbi:MAG: hypothetical protein JRN26_05515 [Nitrososphaerota archaeon]|jgi:hypothetical protein|nr:hypothetical protein [Nitrososphaerota archaeon]MDG6927183.1 hypothetical protein [Nitrososphaerota archaeon]MDG6930829.1 hypothetical protein [Nitrososphaerota archaeon]MDG6932273.1 hypothetical protein [Nitrososphaerota archaeon]MDG6936322.1 hypothetical protein [Nitrososphaerota archaeon]